MPFEYYVLLVAVAAVIYSIIARIVQMKLVDKKEMDQIQAESKRLNEEYKSAKSRSDKAAMEEIMKKQMDLLPKMNKVMLSQFKPMIVILAIFLVFNWAITNFDPSKADDIMMNLSDDGKGCDRASGDGVFSACYDIAGKDYGKWIITAKALNGGSELASNSTFFLYNTESNTDNYLPNPKGEPISLGTDKSAYYPGDKVAITVTPPPKAKEVEVILNNGTSFYVDLPFTIPFINVQRIQEPYWWFIFITIISGIIVSIIYGRLQKKAVSAA